MSGQISGRCLRTSYCNDKSRGYRLAIFSIPTSKHTQDFSILRSIAQGIPGRSSVRFQDGIGRELHADEGCQFGVCAANWPRCGKRRDNRARGICVYRLTTTANTSIEIICHRVQGQVRVVNRVHDDAVPVTIRRT